VLGRIDARRPTSALAVTLVRFRFGIAAAAATAAAAAGLGDGVVAVALVFVVVVIQEVVFPDLLLLLHFGRTHSVERDCQLLLLTVAVVVVVVVVDLRVMRMFSCERENAGDPFLLFKAWGETRPTSSPLHVSSLPFLQS
jgi:heme/copper-type cytochrome/quinol oxidase subunit 4